MTGDTTDVGAPPTMSRIYRYAVEYGPWTGRVQHARAHAIVAAAPPGGGPAPTIFPEMGINSPHFGFTVPANNKVLITPSRDSPLWPPYFRQTAAGFPGRAPQRAPAVFLPARAGAPVRAHVGAFFFRRFCFTVRRRRRGACRWFGPR